MTVGELRQSMSNEEFVYWYQYHAILQQKKELAAKKANEKG